MKINKHALMEKLQHGGRWATLALTLGLVSSPGVAQAQTPQARISPTSVTVTEGNTGTTTATVRVSLDRAPTAPVTLNYQVEDGTATRDLDFTPVTPANNPVIFAAGELGPKTIQVPVLGDTVYEGDETFVVRLLPGTGYTPASGGDRATVTILDDDTRPVFTVDGQTVAEPAPGASGLLTYTVRLSNPSGKTIKLNYATADADSLNTAVQGIDYTRTSGVLTFNPGETVKTVDVPIMGDSTVEADPVVILRVTKADATQEVDPDQVDAQGTIVNDDIPSIFISDAADIVEGADGAQTIARFPVSLSSPSPYTITVTIRTVDGTAISSGSPGDYTAVTDTNFVFFPGQTDKTFDVAVNDDTIKENTEFFSAVISGGGGQVQIEQSQANCRILDNDSDPIISINNPQITEGNTGTTNVSFTATLLGSSTQVVRFNYQTADGTALAGQDYTFTRGTVSFNPGETVKQILVPIIGDTLDEGNEEFRLVLSGAINGSLETRTQAPFDPTCTIVDDDGPTISFLDAAPVVVEGKSGVTTKLTLTVQLNKISPHPVSVQYATLDGTASAASGRADYTATSGTLTFPAATSGNPPQATITVNILGDDVYEGDETFSVILSNAVGGTITGTTALVTIQNDDQVPTLSINDVQHSEGNGPAVQHIFSVTLSAASSQTVTVAYATADASATVADNDYQATSGTLTFAPGETVKTVTVLAIGDTRYEDDESFTVNLSSPNGASIARATGQGTILNDDTAPRVYISTVPSIEETDTTDATKGFNFTIGLSAVSGRPVNVRVTVADGSAVSGKTATPGTPDYALPAGVNAVSTITIPAGVSQVNFPPTDMTDPAKPVLKYIAVVGDTVNEATENFTVTLSNAINASVDPVNFRSVATITDNDKGGTITVADAADVVEPAVNGGVAPDGASAVFKIKLSAAAGQPVRINWSIGAPGGTNQAGPNDVYMGPGSFDIPAGVTERDVTIPIKADNIAEDDETFTFKVTTPTSGWTAPTTDAKGKIIDEDPSVPTKDAFTPTKGYQNYDNRSGFNGNGTDVTIKGTRFQIGTGANALDNITGVYFNASVVRSNNRDVVQGTPATAWRIDSATQITARVPDGASSGAIILVARNGNFLRAPGTFYVMPVVTGFSPERGVRGVTKVTIDGYNLRDGLNPITATEFGGTPANANNGSSFSVVSNTQVVVDRVPRNSPASSPINFVTAQGDGPVSLKAFTVDSVTAGGVTFGTAVNTSAIMENERYVVPGDNWANVDFNKFNSSLHTYDLKLDPAKQSDPGNSAVPNRGSVTAKIVIADNLGTTGLNRVSLPEIVVADLSKPVGSQFVGRGTSVEVVFDAPTDVSAPSPDSLNRVFRVIVVNAGDDIKPPVFASNGFFQDQRPDVNLTVSASIIKTSDSEFYPTGAAASDVKFDRFDPHYLAQPIGTTLRTAEDQKLPENQRTSTYEIALDNLSVANPNDPAYPNQVPVNRDAAPKLDLIIPLYSTNTAEGLISYYVVRPNGTRVERQPIPQPTLKVVFSADPASPDYYGNRHIVQVWGQDDKLQDDDVTYQVRFGNPKSVSGDPTSNSTDRIFSTDPEWNNTVPANSMNVVNTDNEQSVSDNEPGYVFGPSTDGNPPTVTVDEGSLNGTFSVKLRARPTGKVTLWLRSSEPSQFQMIDPRYGTKGEAFPLVFFANPQSNYKKNESVWNVAQTITVVGIPDNVADGTKNLSIITAPVVENTVDPIYKQIDPADVPVQVLDTVSGYGYIFGPSADGTPPTITVNEGGLTGKFTVRLSKQPAGKVTLWLRSSDVTQFKLLDPRTNTLVEAFPVAFFAKDWPNFAKNESRWDVAQTVTVVGVADGVVDGIQNRSIITAPVVEKTDDPFYKTINPADIPVICRDEISGYLVSPSALSVAPGSTNNFEVSLKSAPTSNVVLNFTSRNVAEVKFNAGGSAANSVQLTFTPANFDTPQKVNVLATADTGGGDVEVVVEATATTTDTTYGSMAGPSVTVTKSNSGGGGGGGGTGNEVGPTTFAANARYGISFPYFYTGKNTTINDVFDKKQAAAGFKVFKFRVSYQIGTLLPAGSPSSTPLDGQAPSEDYVELGATEPLERGRGYLLITGNTPVSFKTTTADSNLKPLAADATSFEFKLYKNVTNTAPTSGAKNGLNLIGFPFNTAGKTQYSFENVQVKVGDKTYAKLQDAVAAGIVSSNLYSVNAQGKLTQITGTNRYIKANKAYYIQAFQNMVTLVMRDPS